MYSLRVYNSLIYEIPPFSSTLVFESKESKTFSQLQ